MSMTFDAIIGLLIGLAILISVGIIIVKFAKGRTPYLNDEGPEVYSGIAEEDPWVAKRRHERAYNAWKKIAADPLKFPEHAVRLWFRGLDAATWVALPQDARTLRALLHHVFGAVEAGQIKVLALGPLNRKHERTMEEVQAVVAALRAGAEAFNFLLGQDAHTPDRRALWVSKFTLAAFGPDASDDDMERATGMAAGTVFMQDPVRLSAGLSRLAQSPPTSDSTDHVRTVFVHDLTAAAQAIVESEEDGSGRGYRDTLEGTTVTDPE
jgi:hypothetical protein